MHFVNHFDVNLYEHYQLDARGSAQGILTAYIQKTPRYITGGRKRPAILILPGGAYVSTSQREAEPVALRYLAQGYNAFVLWYTCAPARFPVALREAYMAIRYIRENAEEFEVDPTMVAAIGFSAGGHLCGTVGTMYDCPEVQDLGTPALLRPDAICLSYPVAVSWGHTHEGSFVNISGGDEALRARLSLDKLARPDMPPVFLWHTRDDNSVPVRNSLLLAQKLDELGVSFAMNIYAHGPHGISTANVQCYNAGQIPPHSPTLNSWPEDCISFFAECGFRVTDLPYQE